MRGHGQISRVDLPAFGEYVLYVEEYQDNDPSSIFRQRLYELSADEDEKAVRVELHFFKGSNKYVGAHGDPSKLEGLSPDDTIFVEGCDVFLKRDGDVIACSIKYKACVFSDSENRRYSDHQLSIREDGYWFRNRTRSYNTDAQLESTAP